MKNLHSNKKTVTIVAPCFNEEDLIASFLKEVIYQVENIDDYKFNILIIDNASTDKTPEILKRFAKKYEFLKLIFNTRNFGHIRSPYWGIIQSHSDATIYMASDFQDPPKLIQKFLNEWEKGFKVVLGVKNKTHERNIIIKQFRRFYYHFLDTISEVPITKNATGFGLYDKKVLDIVRSVNDPYPYFRGLISELGFPIKEIEFTQPERDNGYSKNNFYSLYDFALLGIVNHSILPLRFCSILGFIFSIISFICGLIYLVLKILYWNKFSLGLAPIVIGAFFLFGILLFFIGILGEYISIILRYLRNRPVVVEKERINFEKHDCK